MPLTPSEPMSRVVDDGKLPQSTSPEADAVPEMIPALLPCKIAPCETKISSHFWRPKVSLPTPDGTCEVTAYFRGRRLVGKELPLPRGYIGVIPDPEALEQHRQGMKKRSLSSDPDDDNYGSYCDDVGEDAATASTGTGSTPSVNLRPKFRFKKIRILGHEEMPADNLPHMKAVKEWTALAGVIHGV